MRVLRRNGRHRGEIFGLDFNDFTEVKIERCKIFRADASSADELRAVWEEIGGEFDVIIANPPYLVDASERTYRHGGGRLGRELSVRIAESALRRLAPGGRLLLYTGVAIVDGIDAFLEEMAPLLDGAGCLWRYE